MDEGSGADEKGPGEVLAYRSGSAEPLVAETAGVHGRWGTRLGSAAEVSQAWGAGRLPLDLQSELSVADDADRRLQLARV